MQQLPSTLNALQTGSSLAGTALHQQQPPASSLGRALSTDSENFDTPAQWLCGRCTRVNSPARAICETCGAPRSPSHADGANAELKDSFTLLGDILDFDNNTGAQSSHGFSFELQRVVNRSQPGSPTSECIRILHLNAKPDPDDVVLDMRIPISAIEEVSASTQPLTLSIHATHRGFDGLPKQLRSSAKCQMIGLRLKPAANNEQLQQLQLALEFFRRRGINVVTVDIVDPLPSVAFSADPHSAEHDSEPLEAKQQAGSDAADSQRVMRQQQRSQLNAGNSRRADAPTGHDPAAAAVFAPPAIEDLGVSSSADAASMQSQRNGEHVLRPPSPEFELELAGQPASDLAALSASELLSSASAASAAATSADRSPDKSCTSASCKLLHPCTRASCKGESFAFGHFGLTAGGTRRRKCEGQSQFFGTFSDSSDESGSDNDSLDNDEDRGWQPGDPEDAGEPILKKRRQQPRKGDAAKSVKQRSEPASSSAAVKSSRSAAQSSSKTAASAEGDSAAAETDHADAASSDSDADEAMTKERRRNAKPSSSTAEDEAKPSSERAGHRAGRCDKSHTCTQASCPLLHKCSRCNNANWLPLEAFGVCKRGARKAERYLTCKKHRGTQRRADKARQLRKAKAAESDESPERDASAPPAKPPASDSSDKQGASAQRAGGGSSAVLGKRSRQMADLDSTLESLDNADSGDGTNAQQADAKQVSTAIDQPSAKRRRRKAPAKKRNAVASSSAAGSSAAVGASTPPVAQQSGAVVSSVLSAPLPSTPDLQSSALATRRVDAASGADEKASSKRRQRKRDEPPSRAANASSDSAPSVQESPATPSSSVDTSSFPMNCLNGAACVRGSCKLLHPCICEKCRAKGRWLPQEAFGVAKDGIRGKRSKGERFKSCIESRSSSSSSKKRALAQAFEPTEKGNTDEDSQSQNSGSSSSSSRGGGSASSSGAPSSKRAKTTHAASSESDSSSDERNRAAFKAKGKKIPPPPPAMEPSSSSSSAEASSASETAAASSAPDAAFPHAVKQPESSPTASTAVAMQDEADTDDLSASSSSGPLQMDRTAAASALQPAASAATLKHPTARLLSAAAARALPSHQSPMPMQIDSGFAAPAVPEARATKSAYELSSSPEHPPHGASPPQRSQLASQPRVVGSQQALPNASSATMEVDSRHAAQQLSSSSVSQTAGGLTSQAPAGAPASQLQALANSQQPNAYMQQQTFANAHGASHALPSHAPSTAAFAGSPPHISPSSAHMPSNSPPLPSGQQSVQQTSAAAPMDVDSNAQTTPQPSSSSLASASAGAQAVGLSSHVAPSAQPTPGFDFAYPAPQQYQQYPMQQPHPQMFAFPPGFAPAPFGMQVVLVRPHQQLLPSHFQQPLHPLQQFAPVPMETPQAQGFPQPLVYGYAPSPFPSNAVPAQQFAMFSAPPPLPPQQQQPMPHGATPAFHPTDVPAVLPSQPLP